MELEIENAVAWSEAIFGRCDLGDKRLTGRLVKIGSQLSKSQGAVIPPFLTEVKSRGLGS